MTAVSGDMMGEPCCELEATEEELMAEAGMVDCGCVAVAVVVVEGRFVCTRLGRVRLSCEV